jgi:hypothetical protein
MLLITTQEHPFDPSFPHIVWLNMGANPKFKKCNMHAFHHAFFLVISNYLELPQNHPIDISSTLTPHLVAIL